MYTCLRTGCFPFYFLHRQHICQLSSDASIVIVKMTTCEARSIQPGFQSSELVAVLEAGERKRESVLSGFYVG